MQFKWKRICSVLLCAVIVFSFCACERGAESTDACLELVDTPSTTLDNVWYNPGGILRCAVFESLLIPNADMTTLESALAKKYTVSEDEMTYTFQLRDDVTWHDGEIFDGEDVIFSLKMALRSEEINGLIHSAFSFIEGAEEYSKGSTEELTGVTMDGDTLTVQLTNPTGGFLDAIAQFAILPEHILSGIAPEELAACEYWKQPVGCGCYAITEAVEGEYFILEAYEDYYGKAPGVERIRLRFNEENCVLAMQEGRLDLYVTNDPEEMSVLKGVEGCNEYRMNILFPAYLLVNLSDEEGVNPQLQDVRVRKALLLAIDRETIVEAIFPGSTVCDTMVPSWDAMYWEDGEDYSYDPEAAKELLEEAGFDFSKPIRLCYSTKGQSTVDLMNSIAVYWRAIGIQVEVEKFDGSGSEHMFEIRDYDVCYKRLSAFNHSSIYEEVAGDAVMQTRLFHQPVYDEYLAELVVTMDEEEREEMIQQMQALDQEYLFRIPLFSLANVAYVNNDHLKMPDAYGNIWYRYNLCFEDWKLMR